MIAVDELTALEAAVDRALSGGTEAGLRVLGYGEISLVVAWSARTGKDVACKRLPLFDDATRLEAYRACFDDYLSQLRSVGVPVLDSALHAVRRTDGRFAAYCVQPILPADSLAPRQLASYSIPDALRLLGDLCLLIGRSTGPRLGLDGQLSNWALQQGRLVYLDVSTPLMRDGAGRERLDVELFLSSLPWALRGLVRRFLLGSILDKYYHPRSVLLDLMGNLHKEGLGHLVPPLIVQLGDAVQPAFTVEEVRRYYESDASMWRLLQRLRRIDRWWQRMVRRRTYPFLLPGVIER